MFRKRPITSTTLLACTVVNTRCPVRADWMAICAVSGSRISDHDLVRIVAQDGAQPTREGESLLLVHGDLQYTVQLVLHRIFDGDDLVAAGLSLGDRRIQGGGLATAGGTGDEQHAVWQGAQAANFGDYSGVEAEHIQTQAAHLLSQRLLVEHA